MAFIEVSGGSRLYGEVAVQGSKNQALPMLAACVLCKETVKIQGCPKIRDVYSMAELLKSIGCEVYWEENDIIVNSGNISSYRIEQQYVREIRSSINFLGAVLGRLGRIIISYPGGCSIGSRPIDLHLKALEAMNVTIEESENALCCRTEELTGAFVEFGKISVGATENIILAAVLANGTTVISNAAREPEITGLCEFLNALGADITGEGTEIITIRGVKELHGTSYPVMPDRIVAGTYMAAAAAAGGEVFLRMNCVGQLDKVISVLRETEAEVKIEENGILVKSAGHLKAVDFIKTEPWPGFPTDMQSQMMAVLSVSGGTSIIIENIFENRFCTADELRKMGADITVIQRAAVINGVTRLTGLNVTAPDLRGGAALVIAGILARGTTYIHQVEYIMRGYESICGDLASLGARIRLVDEKGG